MIIKILLIDKQSKLNFCIIIEWYLTLWKVNLYINQLVFFINLLLHSIKYHIRFSLVYIETTTHYFIAFCFWYVCIRTHIQKCERFAQFIYNNKSLYLVVTFRKSIWKLFTGQCEVLEIKVYLHSIIFCQNATANTCIKTPNKLKSVMNCFYASPSVWLCIILNNALSVIFGDVEVTNVPLDKRKRMIQ